MQAHAILDVWSTGTPSAYVIRPGLPTDKAFIAKSWADTFRGSEKWIQHIESGFLNRCIYPRIREVLNRAEIRIACPPDDDVVIYGFSVLEPALLHCVYVRLAWRRIGIANSLLSGLGLTHMDWATQSRDWIEWGRSKYPMRHYRPFWMTEGDFNGG